MLKSKEFLNCLLQTAYLPEELPPVVSSRDFAAFCSRHHRTLRAQRDGFLKLSTNYDTYSAPRDKTARRALAVVHPLAQLGISLLITDRRNDIERLIQKSGTSLYRTSEDSSKNRAFAGLDFKKRPMLAAKLHSENPIILQADISRFFYTAYTHTLPWAVLGKGKVKDLLSTRAKRSKLRKHWSSKLDEALQSCHSRETFGFPVGPDTSRIVAEVLLSGVEADSELSPYLVPGKAFRLLDDFSIGFGTEVEARQGLRALRQVLWKYNLQLNDDKTKISTSDMLFREKWKLDFDRVHISQADLGQQARDVSYIVDLALNFCAETGRATPAQWACRQLSRLRVLEGNLDIVLDAMFRLARDFPVCVDRVASFLINNQDKCGNDIVKLRIKAWISSILKSHLPQGHHFEVAWSLVVAGVLRIKLGADDLPIDGTFPGSVVLALVGLLRERGLVDVSLSQWNWRARVHKENALGENWLLHYEAVRRKWTKDKQLIQQINQNATLALALSENVPFLVDSVLDAGLINLDRRTFRPFRSKRTGAPVVHRDEVSGISPSETETSFAEPDEDDGIPVSWLY